MTNNSSRFVILGDELEFAPASTIEALNRGTDVLAGGGETLLAIKMFIEKNNISYCSTGGGAFLEFMEGKELPSLSALGFKF